MVILALIVSRCSLYGGEKPAALSLSNVVCEVQFMVTKDKHHFSSCSVTFRNNSQAKGTLKTPRPMDPRVEPATNAEYEAYGLVISNRMWAVEADFGYTRIDGKKQKGEEQVVLAPGEGKTVDYPLSEFVPWGPCGPGLPKDSFQSVVHPGTNELYARVVIVSAREKQRFDFRPVKVACSFPDWLFLHNRPEEPDEAE